MLTRSFTAALMALALLTACAGNPDPKIQYDYADCTPSGNGGNGGVSGSGNPVAAIVGMLVIDVVVDLSWYYGCEVDGYLVLNNYPKPYLRGGWMTADTNGYLVLKNSPKSYL